MDGDGPTAAAAAGTGQQEVAAGFTFTDGAASVLVGLGAALARTTQKLLEGLVAVVQIHWLMTVTARALGAALGEVAVAGHAVVLVPATVTLQTCASVAVA